MKSFTNLLTVFILLLFFTNCGKDCKPETFNFNIIESYLPDIMPYSDTSTRLFLKNGKDSILFKSLGIKRQIVQEEANEVVCDIYYLQNLSLILSASDTDFFEIKYYATKKEGTLATIRVNNDGITKPYDYGNFRYYYPPIINIDILYTRYDTVNVLYTSNNLCTIYTKPKIGILKFQTLSSVYELIK